jgi:hypothetical protein
MYCQNLSINEARHLLTSKIITAVMPLPHGRRRR